MLTLKIVVALAALSLGGYLMLVAGETAKLRGSWKPLTYHQKDGPVLQVDGRLTFTDTEWTVLYFILQDGVPKQASGEAGTYQLDGDELVFLHRYYLAGQTEEPPKIKVRPSGEEYREECRISLDGDRLTVFFPSGNSMKLVRSSK